MTLEEISAYVMFQTNNDTEDLIDFTPYVMGYINEGYDRLSVAFDGVHVPSSARPELDADADEPDLPEWAHLGVAHWATWCVYRNGNPAKQQRGLYFRDAAERMQEKLRMAGGPNQFKNIPD